MTSDRACVFCGDTSSALTREHVFPNWLNDLFKKKIKTRHVANGPTGPREWESGAFTLQVRLVCANCNNGWMAELEGRLKPLLTELAFSQKKQELGEEQQRDLALWSQKTLFMLSLSNSAGLQIPRGHLDMMGDTHLPDDRILTQIGWRILDKPDSKVSFAGFELHQVPSASVPRDMAESLVQSGGIIWSGTIHLGFLVIKLIGQNVGTLEVGGGDPNVLPQIHPYQTNLQWPTEIPVDEVGGLAAIQAA